MRTRDAAHHHRPLDRAQAVGQSLLRAAAPALLGPLPAPDPTGGPPPAALGDPC
ncbi:MAG: hypothetical protein QJR03_07055 [Sphaerobacter sp.]|nr:hypothetical protein [Sphaerobacter sp.]